MTILICGGAGYTGWLSEVTIKASIKESFILI